MNSNFPSTCGYKLRVGTLVMFDACFPTGYKDFVRNTPSSVIDQVWLILLKYLK